MTGNTMCDGWRWSWKTVCRLGILLPGIKINTSPTDFAPIQQEQLAKFDGERWVVFGELYDASKMK